VRANVFKPAGMLNTDWYEADAATPNLAQGYTTEGSKDGKRHSNVGTRPARGSAAGGGYSTAQDLLKFANAAKSGVFGSLGAEYQGIGIAGGAPGINAALETDLKDRYTVVVLSNYDPPSAESLARKLSQLVERLNE
jgi:CubicO group peptidase (beta-lactamase class C family)